MSVPERGSERHRGGTSEGDRSGIGVTSEWHRSDWFSIHRAPKHRNTNPIAQRALQCFDNAILEDRKQKKIEAEGGLLPIPKLGAAGGGPAEERRAAVNVGGSAEDRPSPLSYATNMLLNNFVGGCVLVAQQLSSTGRSEAEQTKYVGEAMLGGLV